MGAFVTRPIGSDFGERCVCDTGQRSRYRQTKAIIRRAHASLPLAGVQSEDEGLPHRAHQEDLGRAGARAGGAGPLGGGPRGAGAGLVGSFRRADLRRRGRRLQGDQRHPGRAGRASPRCVRAGRLDSSASARSPDADPVFDGADRGSGDSTVSGMTKDLESR